MGRKPTTNDQPSLEQLDYLAWYQNDGSDYPYYDTDAFGRVKHERWQSEVSLESLSESAQESEDDDGEMSPPVEPIHAGDVPSPDVALQRFRTINGMERFSEREKDVLILTHVCLMWPREIAEYLGISVETVKTVQKRAKKKTDQSVCTPKIR